MRVHDREYLELVARRAADSADSGIRACSQRAKSERGHPRGRPTGTFLLVGAGSGSSTWCSTSGPEHLAFTDVRALCSLRWRLLRYGPWCFATILRWMVGTGGLLVDAVVSEA